jgi:hypothetical protein
MTQQDQTCLQIFIVLPTTLFNLVRLINISKYNSDYLQACGRQIYLHMSHSYKTDREAFSSYILYERI